VHPPPPPTLATTFLCSWCMFCILHSGFFSFFLLLSICDIVRSSPIRRTCRAVFSARVVQPMFELFRAIFLLLSLCVALPSRALELSSFLYLCPSLRHLVRVIKLFDMSITAPFIQFDQPSISPNSVWTEQPSISIPSCAFSIMKDVQSSSSKFSRNQVYPRKRPSPYGVAKSQKRSPPFPPLSSSRKSPRAAKAEHSLRRQREAQIAALRREGVYLEEEYREEIRQYMYEMEVGSLPPPTLHPPFSYRLISFSQQFTMSSAQSMDQQPEIRWHMRPCLVDFLVEIHFSFRLRPETLYLTLNIIDRYVSRRIVYVKHYQLVGCAALWIAAKFEDAKERVPSVQDLAQICRDTYEASAFIQMEGHVLSTIQWTLGHPTAEAWLRVICCGPVPEEPKVQHVARFLMEITLFYREFIVYAPSSIALASLTLSRFLCGRARRFFEETEDCLEIVELLDSRLAKHVNDLSETLVKKYSYAFYSKAATFVVQYYLQGGRFVRQPIAALPMTPIRSRSSRGITTPTSISTCASDFSDDMPMTPTSPPPSLPSDDFSNSYMIESDKENYSSSTFEPAFNKQHVETPPDQFLPHDFVTFGRAALHNLNLSSPAVS
jgi:G2/mitotic-specific cyclin-B, other